MELDELFPRIVDDYADALYRFGLRLSGNGQDAEDIAQEALARAYRWLERHSAEGLQLKPWLYQVALNVFRNRLRKQQPQTAALAAADQIAGDDGMSPARLAERSETRRQLITALTHLPLRYREAVVLRHVELLTYPELAAVLKRPEGTIKSDVHRGLALLRAALAPAREEVLA